MAQWTLRRGKTKSTVTIDPLLDNRAVAHVFQRLEHLTASGTTFRVPGFLAPAYCAPACAITSPAALPAALAERSVDAWWFAGMLYVIPPGQVDFHEDNLGDPMACGLLYHVHPITLAQPHTRARRSLDFAIARGCRNEPGPWELSDALTQLRAEWAQPRVPVDLEAIAMLPSLQAWMRTQQHSLHWSDLSRVQHLVRCCEKLYDQQQLRVTHQPYIRDTILGLIGEILLRPTALGALQAATDPTTILLSEGQITTRDGHALSDALLGRLDIATRTLHVDLAFEWSFGSRGAQTMDAQHERTTQARLPQHGLVIWNPAETYATVTVDTSTAQARSQQLDAARAEQIYPLAERTRDELLLYLQLRAGQQAIIPMEEQRLYARVIGLGMRHIGHVLYPQIVQLWHHTAEHTNTATELVHAMDRALTLRIPLVPEAGQTTFRAYQTVLRDMAAPLNPHGAQQDNMTLARFAGVADLTIVSIRDRVHAMLTHYDIPRADDTQRTLRTQRITKRKTAATLWLQAVDTTSTLDDLVAALEENVRAHPDNPFVSAGLLVLRDMAAPLSSRTHQVVDNTLASAAQVSRKKIRSLRAQVTQLLNTRNIPMTDNEEKARAQQQAIHGHEAAELWQHAVETTSALDDLVAQLEQQRAEHPENQYILATLVVIRDLASALNTRGERQAIPALRAHANVSAANFRRLRKRVLPILQARKIPLVPDTRDLQRMLTRKQQGKKAMAIWKDAVTQTRGLNDLLDALTTAQNAHPQNEGITMLLVALKNMAAELNTSGTQHSDSALSRQTGLNRVTLRRARVRVTAELQARKIPLVTE